jgi:hypothetical protein
VGAPTGQGDDLPEVQVVAVGQAEGVATDQSRTAGVREHTDGPEPSTRANESAIYL